MRRSHTLTCPSAPVVTILWPVESAATDSTGPCRRAPDLQLYLRNYHTASHYHITGGLRLDVGTDQLHQQGQCSAITEAERSVKPNTAIFASGVTCKRV